MRAIFICIYILEFENRFGRSKEYFFFEFDNLDWYREKRRDFQIRINGLDMVGIKYKCKDEDNLSQNVK